MKASAVAFLSSYSFFFLLFVMMAAGLSGVEAETCDPSELSPCRDAMLYNSAPSNQCCSELKAQAPCFCQYMKNPTLSPYMGAGKKLATTCGVTIPKC